MKKILHLSIYPLMGILSFSMLSCGAFYGVGYDDGIYGETPKRSYTSVKRTYTSEQENEKYSYRKYLNEKAREHNQMANNLNTQTVPNTYTPLTNTQNYHTQNSGNTTYNSYGAWGSNTPEQVVIYNNYGGYPTPYYDSFWGVGAWYPSYYDRYYSSIHYPYRQGWSVTISGSWGYNPYYYRRGWYYYDSPYAYRYYPRNYYYGYGGDTYRRNNYDNYPRRSYTPGVRRGDEGRYNQNNSYGQGTRRGAYDNNRGTSRGGNTNGTLRGSQPMYKGNSSSNNSSQRGSSSGGNGTLRGSSSSNSSSSNRGGTLRGF